MAADIWFRADVARLLRATHEAMLSTANAPGVVAGAGLAAYREGFCAALSALAAGFGLSEGGEGRAWRALAVGSRVGMEPAEVGWPVPEVIEGQATYVGRQRATDG